MRGCNVVVDLRYKEPPTAHQNCKVEIYSAHPTRVQSPLPLCRLAQGLVKAPVAKIYHKDQLFEPANKEKEIDPNVVVHHVKDFVSLGQRVWDSEGKGEAGCQQAYDPEIGTVHVVSVSGPKLYEITKGKFAKKLGENTQLYQIIDIEKNNLRFRAFTATGELFDEFLLQKQSNKPNKLIEK